MRNYFIYFGMLAQICFMSVKAQAVENNSKSANNGLDAFVGMSKLYVNAPLVYKNCTTAACLRDCQENASILNRLSTSDVLFSAYCAERINSRWDDDIEWPDNKKGSSTVLHVQVQSVGFLQNFVGHLPGTHRLNVNTPLVFGTCVTSDCLKDCESKARTINLLSVALWSASPHPALFNAFCEEASPRACQLDKPCLLLHTRAEWR